MKTLSIKLSILCFLSIICTTTFTQAEILLKADYSGKPFYDYRIKYTSQGNFRQNSSNTAKATKLNVVFTAITKSDKKLAIKVDSCTIKSSSYSDTLQNEIRDKLLKTDYALSLENGFPTPDTSVDIPASSYLELDLYRQLAKLLPTLPTQPVKPGFTWERTQIIPMRTARGKVSCEVYRAYIFDKIVGDSAFVSWKFRYSGNSKEATSNALNEIPVYGTGNGSAVINFKGGYIIRAVMNFTTPVAVIGDVTIVWHENAMIDILEAK